MAHSKAESKGLAMKSLTINFQNYDGLEGIYKGPVDDAEYGIATLIDRTAPSGNHYRIIHLDGVLGNERYGFDVSINGVKLHLNWNGYAQMHTALPAEIAREHGFQYSNQNLTAEQIDGILGG